ncbi:hemerythrin HHE cation binding domain-containing protein [Nostoc sp. NIES-3756]|uniref:hemerythrin domain-containing protein n=1 Tax=Nostoc sp. NIES-3756 TaxID=1751286 RepID=UPI00071FDA2A|nr:hemerythrin domain-containing protein [Nostoc sp. NIES-3756]BAT53838.1 hemerythrin HHE cation binding domain-containing protein [Nostoc sp. NIES-3756]BAY38425.1 hemerythrin HHE cation binding domain-containing protein [Nostoc sp. NIES-2111]
MAKAKATDILSLIEAEHRQVEQLFTQIEKAKGNKIPSYFQEIYKALNLHARTEELAFYPALREYEETQEYIEEAEEEHEDVSVLLEEIKAMKPNDPEFLEKISELKQAVQHHVEEEESEIFDAVRECMSEEQLTALGEEFKKAKAKLEPDVEAALAQ